MSDRRTVMDSLRPLALSPRPPTNSRARAKEASHPKKPFKGVIKLVIKLDVRDSKPNWAPFIPAKALAVD